MENRRTEISRRGARIIRGGRGDRFGRLAEFHRAVHHDPDGPFQGRRIWIGVWLPVFEPRMVRVSEEFNADLSLMLCLLFP